MQATDDDRFQQHGPFAQHAIVALQPGEHLDLGSPQVADLHLGDPPGSRLGAQERVVFILDVQHAVGRHEERPSPVRSQPHLREHARADHVFRVLHDELHIEDALVLRDHRRYPRHLSREDTFGQGVEPHLARHPGLHKVHEPLGHFGDYDIPLGGSRAKHGWFQARLLKLARQGGLGASGQVYVLFLIVDVLASLNLILDEIGLLDCQVLGGIRTGRHQFLHPRNDFLLSIDFGLVQIAHRFELGLLELDVPPRLLPIREGGEQIGGCELPRVLRRFLAGTQAGQNGSGHGQNRRGQPSGLRRRDLKFLVQRRARLDADQSRAGDLNGAFRRRRTFAFLRSGNVLAAVKQVGQCAARHGERQSQLNRQAGTVPQRAEPRLRGRWTCRIRGSGISAAVRHAEDLPLIA